MIREKENLTKSIKEANRRLEEIRKEEEMQSKQGLGNVIDSYNPGSEPDSKPNSDYLLFHGLEDELFNIRHESLRDILLSSKGNFSHLIIDGYMDTKQIAGALLDVYSGVEDEIRIRRRAFKLLQACIGWVNHAGPKSEQTIASVREVLNTPLEEKLKAENQYEADVLLQYGPLEEIFLSPEIPQWIKYLYMESKMTDECDRYDVLFEAADALTDVLYITLED